MTTFNFSTSNLSNSSSQSSLLENNNENITIENKNEINLLPIDETKEDLGGGGVELNEKDIEILPNHSNTTSVIEPSSMTVMESILENQTIEVQTENESNLEVDLENNNPSKDANFNQIEQQQQQMQQEEQQSLLNQVEMKDSENSRTGNYFLSNPLWMNNNNNFLCSYETTSK